MSKAFDSLHPPLLLSKLKAYGFQEGTIQLLNSYLCDRKYRVKIGSHTSSSRTISRGCPQGSSLGALMWNIFQMIFFVVVKSSLSMYGDDHQMFHVGNDQSTFALELRETARNATSPWAKTPKNSFRGTPVRHSEIGIKLKLIVYILIIHLLLFM